MRNCNTLLQTNLEHLIDRKILYAAVRRRASGIFGTSLTQGQVDGVTGILDAFATHGDGAASILALTGSIWPFVLGVATRRYSDIAFRKAICQFPKSIRPEESSR